ncbi:MAG: hypothetical protein AAGA62_08780, partial [Bacteroidota bacterium]
DPLWRESVRVKEIKKLTLGRLSTGIHLDGPTLGRMNERYACCFDQAWSCIRTATVDYNNFTFSSRQNLLQVLK